MKILLFLSVLLSCMTVQAQNAFWSFNDNQEPMTIAPECDASFDEVKGGVFVPSVEEVYRQGLLFLDNPSDEIKRQAPYCFLSAALQGHAEAQFQLAKLYNKGDILPQDDLSSYKWAFIAALNGQKDAESFTLNLEQVLTTQDLEATTPAIRQALTKIQENTRKQQEALQQELAAATAKEGKASSRSFDTQAPMPTNMSDIFTEKDRF